jgi:uncharacterized membrane protein YbhN (UPF0104 family)
MKRVAAALVGAGVSALALWLAFRHVEGAELWRALRAAKPGWLVGFAALGVGSWGPRALQLRALARRRDGQPPRFWACWHAIGAAMLVQNVLPARVGEAARVVALARAGEVAPSVATGAVVLGRVLDLPALVLMTCLPCLLLPVGAVGALRTVALVGSGIGLALVALCFVLAHGRERSARALGRLHPAIGRAAAGFIDGLSAVRSLPRLALAFAAACGAVLVVVGSYTCALYAFGLQTLPTGTPLALVATVFLAVAIPAAPSSLGTYHAALIWLCVSLGAPKAEAAAMALATHALAVCAHVAAGSISLVRVGLHLRDRAL